MLDALAVSLLALPGARELHIRRLDAHGGWPRFAVAYRGRPLRSRSYVPGDWTGPGVERVLTDRRPLAVRDPGLLPAGLAGRRVPATLFCLGNGETLWGVGALLGVDATYSAAGVPAGRAEAEARLVELASRAKGPRRDRTPAPSPATGAGLDADSWCLSQEDLRQALDEEISRAQRLGTPLSVIAVKDASSTPDVALRSIFRRFDRVGRLTTAVYLVVLPGTSDVAAQVLSRRLLEHFDGPEVDPIREGGLPRNSPCVGVFRWDEQEGADDLVERARRGTERCHEASRSPSGAPGRPLPFNA